MSTGLVAMDLAVTINKLVLPNSSAANKLPVLLVKFLDVRRGMRSGGGARINQREARRHSLALQRMGTGVAAWRSSLSLTWSPTPTRASCVS